MGLLDAVKSDINGALGNITKAVLIFPEIQITNTRTEESAHNKMLEGLDTMASALSSVDPTGTVASLTSALSDLGMDAKSLTVQFNPASLSIDANGGGFMPVVNISNQDGKGGSQYNYDTMPVYINVSFTLVFDATYIADAFMSEKASLNATKLLKAAAALATHKEYSVRPFVEGFIAALRDPDHRMMIFQWNKMRYVGIMNSINCQYTMFNPNGEPIRAEVMVNLVSDSYPKQTYKEEERGGVTRSVPVSTQTNQNDCLKYWIDRYTSILKDKSSMSGSTLKNVATNFLNF